MARFRFSLEALLRLRETEEERERETLESIAQQIRFTEELLQRRAEERRRHRQITLARLVPGIAGEEMLLDEFSRAAMARGEEAIARQLKDLKTAWDEQYKKYLEARQRSEILRTLRSEQHAEFVAAQKRAEQQEADDLYNLRAVRSARENF